MVKAISKLEVESLIKRRFAEQGVATGPFDTSTAQVWASLTPNSAHPVAIARLLAKVIGGGDVCVFIHEYGIWPSSEDLNLYQHLTNSLLGIGTFPNEAPGLLFQPTEEDDLATVLHLAVHFGWGAVAFGHQADTRMLIDHDGQLAVWCNPNEVEALVKELEDRHLDVRSPGLDMQTH